jgi:hypothetical protein
MQNTAKISPTNFRVTFVLGTKRQGDETTWDETARGQSKNNHVWGNLMLLVKFLGQT